VTFTPTAALAANTQYTVAVSGARDAAGNTMQPVTWTFTTAATSVPSGCPCTIFAPTTVPPVEANADPNPVEVGVKFRADRDGFVTAIRFYKGTGNTGPHVGNLWTAGGTLLATVQFTGESATGWQETTLASPVAVTANTIYVASYSAPSGRYALGAGGFASDVVRGPLTAPASAGVGGNGVYVYGGGGFPSETFNASNYYVDVVFNSTAADTTAPTITSRAPADGATSVPVASPVVVTFSEPVVETTIGMTLTGPAGAVAGTRTYDAATRTATFTPSAALAYSTTYQAAVSGAQDPTGNTMAPATWSFTTAAPPPPLPTEGPGGPIGVVTSGTDAFSGYLAEIVRSEGFNEFTTLDVGTVNATTLAPFRTVVLGRVSLTAAQVTALTSWVQGGGNLVASRPDQQLASLLGLTPVGGTLSEGYIRVDTSSEPGGGIVGETMQFHGAADRYSLTGATAVATLYSSATTPTSYPAVTLRAVGTNGGHAAAFMYDLARSVVLTRQGNVAWAGSERDGDPDNVIRSDDLYFGGAVADWVDFTKIAIPQADEQQRLLANLVQLVNRDAMPLPRFWYFPGQYRAVVVATGDDHANGGTSGRFNTYLAADTAGCSTTNWQCHRFSSYIYTATPLSNAQASSYNAQDFEIGLHPQNSCQNFTPTSLRATYTGDLGAWRQKYTSLPSPVTNRFHCLVWSDWASQFEVESENGMRFDTNYYYWPGSWLQDRPGFMTGSGMPQRFARSDGTMVDVYQGATQMTDESGQSYPFTPDTLLDRALGTQGYYGYFVANMHTDSPTTQQDTALVSSATSRGVPVVSARDAFEFIDGRNRSSFQDLTWSGTALGFRVVVGPGATNLTAMVPTAGPNGSVLQGISRGATSVSYQLQTIKGAQYAVFAATAATYTATYGGGAAPQIAPTATTIETGGTAFIAWETDQPASSEVVYGTSSVDLSESIAQGGVAGDHAVELEGLEAGETYYYRVMSETPGGDTSVWPPESRAPARLTVPSADRVAPRITHLAVSARADGTALVTWHTDEPGDAAVLVGATPSTVERRALGGDGRTDHSVVVTGLDPNTTYYVRAESTDAAGNRSSTTGSRKRIITPAAGVAEYMAASFRVGQLSGAAVIVEDDTGLGTVTLPAGAGAAGAFRSRVLDSWLQTVWDRATWEATVPAGASITVRVRAGNSETPDATWSDWVGLDTPGARVDLTSRFIQYEVELRSGTSVVAPALHAMSITHSSDRPEAVGEHGTARHIQEGARLRSGAATRAAHHS
jgi:Domain of unknown function (DUF4082)/Bacterial Ig-like domain/Purple acid Phosphatase, N-terminal domain